MSAGDRLVVGMVLFAAGFATGLLISERSIAARRVEAVAKCPPSDEVWTEIRGGGAVRCGVLENYWIPPGEAQR